MFRTWSRSFSICLCIVLSKSSIHASSQVSVNQAALLTVHTSLHLTARQASKRTKVSKSLENPLRDPKILRKWILYVREFEETRALADMDVSSDVKNSSQYVLSVRWSQGFSKVYRDENLILEADSKSSAVTEFWIGNATSQVTIPLEDPTINPKIHHDGQKTRTLLLKLVERTSNAEEGDRFLAQKLILVPRLKPRFVRDKNDLSWWKPHTIVTMQGHSFIDLPSPPVSSDAVAELSGKTGFAAGQTLVALILFFMLGKYFVGGALEKDGTCQNSGNGETNLDRGESRTGEHRLSILRGVEARRDSNTLSVASPEHPRRVRWYDEVCPKDANGEDEIVGFYPEDSSCEELQSRYINWHDEVDDSDESQNDSEDGFSRPPTMQRMLVCPEDGLSFVDALHLLQHKNRVQFEKPSKHEGVLAQPPIGIDQNTTISSVDNLKCSTEGNANTPTGDEVTFVRTNASTQHSIHMDRKSGLEDGGHVHFLNSVPNHLQSRKSLLLKKDPAKESAFSGLDCIQYGESNAKTRNAAQIGGHSVGHLVTGSEYGPLANRDVVLENTDLDNNCASKREKDHRRGPDKLPCGILEVESKVSHSVSPEKCRKRRREATQPMCPKEASAFLSKAGTFSADKELDVMTSPESPCTSSLASDSFSSSERLRRESENRIPPEKIVAAAMARFPDNAEKQTRFDSSLPTYHTANESPLKMLHSQNDMTLKKSIESTNHNAKSAARHHKKKLLVELGRDADNLTWLRGEGGIPSIAKPNESCTLTAAEVGVDDGPKESKCEKLSGESTSINMGESDPASEGARSGLSVTGASETMSPSKQGVGLVSRSNIDVGQSRSLNDSFLHGDEVGFLNTGVEFLSKKSAELAPVKPTSCFAATSSVSLDEDSIVVDEDEVGIKSGMEEFANAVSVKPAVSDVLPDIVLSKSLLDAAENIEADIWEFGQGTCTDPLDLTRTSRMQSAALRRARRASLRSTSAESGCAGPLRHWTKTRHENAIAPCKAYKAPPCIQKGKRRSGDRNDVSRLLQGHGKNDNDPSDTCCRIGCTISECRPAESKTERQTSFSNSSSDSYADAASTKVPDLSQSLRMAASLALAPSWSLQEPRQERDDGDHRLEVSSMIKIDSPEPHPSLMDLGKSRNHMVKKRKRTLLLGIGKKASESLVPGSPPAWNQRTSKRRRHACTHSTERASRPEQRKP